MQDHTEIHQVELLHPVSPKYSIYSMTTNGCNTLYFLTDFSFNFFSNYKLNQLDVVSAKHQKIKVFKDGTNLFAECHKLCFFQGSLCFLEYMRTEILNFSLLLSEMTSHFDYNLKGIPDYFLVDEEGAAITNTSFKLIKITSQGYCSIKLPVFNFCLDPEGNVVVVHGKRVCRVLKDFKKVEEVRGYESGYVDGSVKNAGFCDLKGVCCDEYGSIFVVDTTDPGERPKIRMIEDGWVSTIPYEMEEGFLKNNKQEMSKICVVGEYLVGVWNEQQIFRMKLEDRHISKWPYSHKKFKKKKQQIVEEVWLIIKKYGMPKDLTIYCIQTLLWTKKLKF